ncbi:MAG TPA: M56 family metallopeptidase [Verrucomicrobiae bacterium]|jgi:bla regulator protein BlaR1
MNTFLTLNQNAFEWTWETSAYAGVLAAFVFLVQKLLGKWLIARLRYTLSLLVLLRLPFVPASPLSFDNLLSVSVRKTSIPTAQTPTGETGLQAALGARNFSRQFSISDALGLVWLMGASALAALAVWRYRKWNQRIRCGTVVTDPRLLDLLESARQTMGVRRRVALVTVEDPASPAVFGVLRVRLLCPRCS